MPLVSVIIPTYQRKDLVKRAVSSALSQTYRDVEVIVVDDGSTDGTKEELKKDRSVRFIAGRCLGASAARNDGAQEARGEFLAFLDSDDEWEKDKIELQLEAMRKEAADVSLSGAKVMRDGKELAVSNRRGWLSQKDIFKVRRPISASTLMVSKVLFDKVMFDEYLWSANDLDFLLRAKRTARVLSLEESSVLIHKSDRRPRLSNDHARKSASYRRVLKKAFRGEYALGAADSIEFAVRLLAFICAFFGASLLLRDLRAHRRTTVI